MGEIKKSPNCC